MPNDKAQNPNERKNYFWYLSIGISIVIWILILGFI